MKSSYVLECNGGTLTARMHGETTQEVTSVLRAELTEALERPDVTTLAVDVSGLIFMNTTGINMLVLLRKMCGEKGRHFVLLRPSEQVLKVLRLVQLADYFDIRDSLGE